MSPTFSGAKRFNKNPIAVPKSPTIVKKQKFIMLTAVPETILRLVKCRTGTSNDVKLALPAKTQNIIAISGVLILKIKHVQIVSSDKNVITEAFFKNTTLWLWHILQTDALIILKAAAIIAIIERTTAAFAVGIQQKSSKNFLPIIACIA